MVLLIGLILPLNTLASEKPPHLVETCEVEPVTVKSTSKGYTILTTEEWKDQKTYQVNYKFTYQITTNPVNTNYLSQTYKFVIQSNIDLFFDNDVGVNRNGNMYVVTSPYSSLNIYTYYNRWFNSPTWEDVYTSANSYMVDNIPYVSSVKVESCNYYVHDDMANHKLQQILNYLYNLDPNNLGLSQLEQHNNELVENGNQASQDSSKVLDTSNNILNTEISKFDEIEKNFTNDFNKHINDIDLTNNKISSNANFLKSMNFVKTSFDTIVDQTPLKSVVFFALILGVTALLIGKR